MASEPRFDAISGQHIPYWNTVLQHDYCHADGEPWPCLFYRQNRPAKCKCSHVKHDGICWSRACGCREYRPDDVAASMDRHPAGKAIPQTEKDAS
jgi:hypothetical protein